MMLEPVVIERLHDSLDGYAWTSCAAHIRGAFVGTFREIDRFETLAQIS